MFIWDEKLNTGIKDIDDQHKTFFKIGEKINQQIIDYNGEDIHDHLYDLFIDLIEYSIFHFKTEEDYLEKIHYPHLEEHRSAHQAFVDKLHSIDLKKLVNDQGEMAFDFLSMVSEWITNHIILEDMHYTKAF